MSSWVQQPRQALKSAFHSPSSSTLTPASFPPSLKPRGNYIDVSNRAGHSTVAFSAHFWPLMSLCITHCRKNWEIFLLTKWPTERHRHAKFLHSSSKLQLLSMKDLINQLKIILLTYVWDLIHRINTLFSKLSQKVSPPLVFTISSAASALCFKDWFAPIVNNMQMNAFRQAYKLHWLPSEQSSLQDWDEGLRWIFRLLSIHAALFESWELLLQNAISVNTGNWLSRSITNMTILVRRHRMCPKYLSHHACYFYGLCG